MFDIIFKKGLFFSLTTSNKSFGISFMFKPSKDLGKPSLKYLVNVYTVSII